MKQRRASVCQFSVVVDLIASIGCLAFRVSYAPTIVSAIIPRMNPRDKPPDDDRTLPPDKAPKEAAPASSSSASSLTPASIGNYTILGKLGEGGMGVVYEAEQQNPQRKVALKVVRGGRLVDELSVRMFEREAETLGRLKHPAIGAIYESGRTKEGQHFFAMELVRGETLHARTPGELTRAELRRHLSVFRKICDGVNYAHQRGVIHRDLKPSNILISEEGEPKILDFGLARITDADTATTSMVSEVGSIKGTLQYMSPEQAGGNPEEIDLRTDVYSLGVLLYEVLNGTLPYDTGTGSLMESVRVIEEQPPAPFRLSNSELETITRKALEKDPAARYQSAAALSDDIERYLTNQPILARPPSTIYQLKKLVARNKLPFAFAVSVGVLLAGFAVTSTVQAQRIARERDRAEAEAAKSNAMNYFMRNMLTSADPWSGGETDRTVAEALDGAVQELDDGALGNEPLVEAEMRSVIANTYHALGKAPRGTAQAERSLEIRVDHLGPDHPDVAESWIGVLLGHQNNREFDKAIEACRELVRIWETKQGGPSQETINAQFKLARNLGYAGRFDEADSITTIAERLSVALVEDSLMNISSAATIRSSIAHYGKNDLVAADSFATKAYRYLYAIDPNHLDIAVALGDVAMIRMAQGNLEDAGTRMEEVVALEKKVRGEDHPSYATALENLGNIRYQQDRYDETLEYLGMVRDIRSRNLGEDHINVTRTMANMAVLMNTLERRDESLVLYEEIDARLRAHYGEEHQELAQILRNKGLLFRDLERHAEADATFREAMTMYVSLLGADHLQVARTRSELGGSYANQRRWRDAEAELTEAIPVMQASYGADHFRTKRAEENLARVYEATGRPALAAELKRGE